MKRLVVMLGAISLGLGGDALPQQPPDGWSIIGIYSGDFSGPTGTHFEGTGEITLHLILSGRDWVPDCGVAGWELFVDLRGTGATFLGTTLLGEGPMNLVVPPNFQVGLGGPLTTVGPYGTYRLAELRYQVVSTEPTYLFIEPTRPFPSMPGQPCWTCWCATCELYRLLPSSGALELPVFGFNTGPLVIPVDMKTWGGVKARYR